MNATTIRLTPAIITVSDERGAIDGAQVEVLDGGAVIASGSAIPVEGDSMDCWLDRALLGQSDEVLSTIHTAMTRAPKRVRTLDLDGCEV